MYRLALVALSVAFAISYAAQAQVTQTILTDADAGVRVVCRGDVSEADCLLPRGVPGPNPLDNDSPYLRVHDQNALDVAYLHFNLSGIAPGAQVTAARFQLDVQNNSWGDTSVSVVAIADDRNDWDLTALPENQIIGRNAPKADYLEWEEGDMDFNRFNTPRPFLDEGTATNSAVRLLNELPIFVPNQDPVTQGDPGNPGNSYGGYAHPDAGGEGLGGSADGGDNVWPIKDAVDLDITELVRWKLGQNAAYSTFAPSDRELTVMVRTEIPEAGGGNGFIRFLSRESPYVGGELSLAPGRILITSTGGALPGDFNSNGVLDEPDVNDLSAEILAGTNTARFDLTGDAAVNSADLTQWVSVLKKTWFGDANLDGLFNSSDFVDVFTDGKYETGQSANWGEGNWNADGKFDSGDFVAAFSDGGYEAGPKPAVAAVPEPIALVLALLGLVSLAIHRRRARA
jgi:hypothetical protein